jgi:hypothetical protein
MAVTPSIFGIIISINTKPIDLVLIVQIERVILEGKIHRVRSQGILPV